MPSSTEWWMQLCGRNVEQSWSRTYDIPDAGDSDRGMRGSVQSLRGGPELAHSCEPSRPRIASHASTDGGQHTTSATCGTSSVEGGCHGLQQGGIQCRLGNDEDGQA